jgi:SAM-dependent methyltransferase
MTTPGQPPSVGQRFDIAFTAAAASPTLQRIWRQAYGGDYPEDADPTSWVTLTDLRRAVDALRVRQGQTIIDLGSGRGGPGLWLARETGADLIGIDLSGVGVSQANARATAAGLAQHVHFQVGDLTATELPNAACDGAVSFDVLALVPDQAAAAREVARILRPGSRFVFTSIEQRKPGSSPQGVAPVENYRPLLEAAGFFVEVHEEAPDWERRQRAALAGIVAAETDLQAEVGHAAAEGLLHMARTRPAEMHTTPRMFVIALRP